MFDEETHWDCPQQEIYLRGQMWTVTVGEFLTMPISRKCAHIFLHQCLHFDLILHLSHCHCCLAVPLILPNYKSSSSTPPAFKFFSLSLPAHQGASSKENSCPPVTHFRTIVFALQMSKTRGHRFKVREAKPDGDVQGKVFFTQWWWQRQIW